MNHNELVLDIYSAVHDSEKFPYLLNKISKYLGDCTVYLCQEPLVRFDVGEIWTHRLDMSVCDKFSEAEFTPQGNKAIAAVLSADVGELIDIDSFVTDLDWDRDIVFREFLATQGLRHTVYVTFTRADGVISTGWIARERQHGPIEKSALTRLRALVPHISQAMHLRQQLKFRQSQSNQYSSIIDKFGGAIFFVDSKRKIKYSNHAAKHLLTLNDGLVERQGCLCLQNEPLQRAFVENISKAAAPLQFSPSIVEREPVLSVPRRTTAGPDYRLILRPVVNADGPQWATQSQVAVFAVDLCATSTKPTLESIQAILGLTVSQARVARLAYFGLSKPGIANTLGKSENTIRRHVQDIFERTGVNSVQALSVLIQRWVDCSGFDTQG